MKRWLPSLLLGGLALATGVISMMMHSKAQQLAEHWHWDYGTPPTFRSALTVYQLTGILAACLATAALLMVPAVRSRFRARVISPVLARRPLSPRYLLLLYCLGFLVFVLSYNVPLLGQVSDRAEEVAALVFLPFSAIAAVGVEPVLAPLAHGFSPSDHELFGWDGNPYLAWLFVLALVAFGYCSLRIGFWFASRAEASTKDGPPGNQQGT